MSRLQRVRGTCPACGRPDLAVTGAGYLVCCDQDCPRNTAAAELLMDPVVEHVIQLDRDGFTMRHPLIERLDDALLTCSIHAEIADRVSPPMPTGRYLVTRPLERGPLVFVPYDQQEQS